MFNAPDLSTSFLASCYERRVATFTLRKNRLPNPALLAEAA